MTISGFPGTVLGNTSNLDKPGRLITEDSLRNHLMIITTIIAKTDMVSCARDCFEYLSVYLSVCIPLFLS